MVRSTTRSKLADAQRLIEDADSLWGEPFENMLVEGDNLPVLRALMPRLEGFVDCVYIDPPYDTGQRREHYGDARGRGAWLDFMRPRLELLRRTLSPSGSLFVQLDDNLVDYAKVMLDEIFGDDAFVSRITLRARAPSAFSTVNRGLFKASEYVLWYARERLKLKEHKLRVARPFDRAYGLFVEGREQEPARWRLRSLREVFLEAGGGDAAALEAFVVANAAGVCRKAAIRESKAGKSTADAKRRSLERPGEILVVRREGRAPRYVLDGAQLIFYDKNVALIDGVLRPSACMTNIWTDLSWEGIATEGGVRFRGGKKPERLLARVLELVTDAGDLVLDVFAGSGTTGAVAHKMGRHWMMIEEGEQLRTHIVPRIERVLAGLDPSGVTSMMGFEGGGGFTLHTWPGEGEGNAETIGR
ncbi:MAG: site-specific DNA-methyltransferase [Deltaproteobacteria bacterium]|nr:site-specific DNA-methyltransferase [Deltaproteobacteria bacterium]